MCMFQSEVGVSFNGRFLQQRSVLPDMNVLRNPLRDLQKSLCRIGFLEQQAKAFLFFYIRFTNYFFETSI